MPDITGHCRCGRVTFATTGPVLWSGICHCESCRRATASPCTAFVGVPRDSVAWAGDPKVSVSSEGTVQRLFCPDCGTQLAYQADRWRDESHLYTATLDDPNAVKPTAHFHWAERLPWLKIDDDLPKYATSADGAAPT